MADLNATFDAGLDDGIFTDSRILLTGHQLRVRLRGEPHWGRSTPTYRRSSRTESIPKGSIELGASLLFGTSGIELNGTLPGGEFVSIPDDLFEVDLSDFSLLDNLLLAIDGIDAFLAGLQDILDGEVFGVQLPLIGDKLSSAAQFIEDFREGFIEDFRNEVGNTADPDNNFVSTKLFELLGPSGLNILLDSDDPGTDINVADVVLTTNVDEPGVELEDNFIQWNMNLGGTLLDVGTGIAFDIGLPGFGPWRPPGRLTWTSPGTWSSGLG